MLYIISIILLCLILISIIYLTHIMHIYRLHQYNNPSTLFQVVYALYNTHIGQLLHWSLLYLQKPIKHTISCQSPDEYPGFLVYYVPYLTDNYAYIIQDKSTSKIAIIDPADPMNVLDMMHTHVVSSELCYVLCTHKHMDHAAGNHYIRSRYSNIRVVCGQYEHVCGQNYTALDGDRLYLGNTVIQIIYTPGHTVGHVSYYVSEKQSDEGAVFTGDTLFIGGCGRFFEGSPKDMYTSLYDKLLQLPPSTAVYCGHEYTVSNLQFCAQVEPENKHIQNKLIWAETQRLQRKPTIPSTLQDELMYNVFLRARELLESRDTLRCYLLSEAGTENDKELEAMVIGTLRKWKDSKKRPTCI